MKHPRLRLTGPGWVVLAALVGLVVAAIVTQSRAAYIALAALLAIVAAGEVASWSSNRDLGRR